MQVLSKFEDMYLLDLMTNIRLKSKDIELIELKFKDDFKDILIPT